ncbi:MAG: indolepyruvate oxidoreductase subunit beta [Spirochaetales bacterium]|nr:indolepyruvate oxidoreductase subunit beta [Spirochaetales bacterium]
MDTKIFNILMVGVGGQGIILSSNILTRAALNAGYDVKKSEIHGMSQRGGSVFSHVRFGARVQSPLIARGEADVLVSLEKMETLRWLEWANSDTQLVVLEEQLKPAMVETYPEGINAEIAAQSDKVLFLDPKQLVEKVGQRKYLNVAILGVVSRFVAFDQAHWRQAISDLVPADSASDNLKAFGTGRSLV